MGERFDAQGISVEVSPRKTGLEVEQAPAHIGSQGAVNNSRIAHRFLVTHYTLNTGHSNDSPRSGVGPEAIAVLRPLVEHGGPIPNCAPFRVTIDHGAGSAVFTVWRAQEPIVTCALAWTAEGESEAWPAIEKLYLDTSDRFPELLAPARVAEKPASLPWLAVVLLPSLLHQRADDVGWLGDFERCMAWTVLDSIRG